MRKETLVKRSIAILATVLLWPATAAAHSPSITERIEAKYAAAELEVEVGPCVKHKHWSDCVVTAEVEDGRPLRLYPERFEWVVRVSPHSIVKISGTLPPTG